MVFMIAWIGFIKNSEDGDIQPIIPFTIFAISNVFGTASLWPSIPYAVPPEMLGVAYGIMISLFNLCVTVLPLFLGLIHDASERYDHGYAWPLAFIITWLLMGVYDAILLSRYDANTGYKLYISEHENKM